MNKSRPINRYSRIVDINWRKENAESSLECEYYKIHESVEAMCANAKTKEDFIEIEEIRLAKEKAVLDNYASILLAQASNLMDYFETRGGHNDDECQGKCNFICEYDRGMYDVDSLISHRRMGRH